MRDVTSDSDASRFSHSAVRYIEIASRFPCDIFRQKINREISFVGRVLLYRTGHSS